MNTHVTTAMLLSLMLAGCAAQGLSRDANPMNVEVCRQDAGCSMQARPGAATPSAETGMSDAAAVQRIEALQAHATEDPRAAFDLGLRFFRGDGVRRDTYQALSWMRMAAERGHVPAQLALGRFYLSGLEEMGSDPAEAESWLTAAARHGDAEAARLLGEARKARQDEQAWWQWREARRQRWLDDWRRGYGYYLVWHGNGWRDR